MFKQFKEKLGLEVSELITLISVIAIFYATLYQLIFLSTLGADWYLSFLTTQQILFSILLAVVMLIVGAFIGFVVFKLFKFIFNKLDINLNRANFFMIFLFAFIFFLANSVLESVYISIFSLSTYLIYTILENYNNNNHYYNKKKYIIFMTFIFIIAPFALARTEATKILKEPSKYLSQVHIKNKQGAWYLVETNSTQVLLLEKTTDNFVLVKVEDIERVIPPKKISYLDNFNNYFKHN